MNLTPAQKSHIDKLKRELDYQNKNSMNEYNPEMGYIENRPYMIWGEHDEKTRNQFFRALTHPLGRSGTLCADGHYGYGQPIGSAISYDGISVSGVGYDIGCGLRMTQTGVSFEEVLEVLPDLAEIVQKAVPIKEGPGISSSGFTLGTGFTFHYDMPKEARDVINKEIKGGFGSLGGGNHFFNVMEDIAGNLSFVCHSGSRSYGHAISQYFYDKYEHKDSFEDPLVIPNGSKDNRGYFDAMNMAASYASASRMTMIEAVWRSIRVEFIKRRKPDSTHAINRGSQSKETQHNVAMRSSLNGLSTSYKGCFPTNNGIIASSMADDIYFVQTSAQPHQLRGDGHTFTPHAMPHGAGRLYSRTKARKELSEDVQKKRLEERGIILIGGGIDESPEAYRNVQDVIRAHSAKVTEILTPKIVIME